MALKYDQVVPWGRNFDEYCRMFDLSEDDLKRKILGCADGPANFNSICNANGGNVVSIDPIYSLTKQQIQQRINETYENVISQTRKNQEKFLWNTIKSVDELGEIRMNAMMEFLDTYEESKKKGRYLPETLPSLSFPDCCFDLSLSSHFLFLYSDNLSCEFHKQSIIEMLRVSNEARIFPLLDVNAKKSDYVYRIMQELTQYVFEIRKVNYEFQIGGFEMMVVRRK